MSAAVKMEIETEVCTRCGAGVPVGNKVMHELRCTARRGSSKGEEKGGKEKGSANGGGGAGKKKSAAGKAKKSRVKKSDAEGFIKPEKLGLRKYGDKRNEYGLQEVGPTPPDGVPANIRLGTAGVRGVVRLHPKDDGVDWSAKDRQRFAQYCTAFNVLEYPMERPHHIEEEVQEEAMHEFRDVALGAEGMEGFEMALTITMAHKGTLFFTEQSRITMEKQVRMAKENLGEVMGPIVLRVKDDFKSTKANWARLLAAKDWAKARFPKNRFAFDVPRRWSEDKAFRCAVRRSKICLVQHDRRDATEADGSSDSDNSSKDKRFTPLPLMPSKPTSKTMAYIRLCGIGDTGGGDYGPKEMKRLAVAVRKWAEDDREVYVVFGNTRSFGSSLTGAVVDCQELGLRLKRLYDGQEDAEEEDEDSGVEEEADEEISALQKAKPQTKQMQQQHKQSGKRSRTRGEETEDEDGVIEVLDDNEGDETRSSGGEEDVVGRGKGAGGKDGGARKCGGRKSSNSGGSSSRGSSSISHGNTKAQRANKNKKKKSVVLRDDDSVGDGDEDAANHFQYGSDEEQGEQQRPRKKQRWDLEEDDEDEDDGEEEEEDLLDPNQLEEEEEEEAGGAGAEEGGRKRVREEGKGQDDDRGAEAKQHDGGPSKGVKVKQEANAPTAARKATPYEPPPQQPQQSQDSVDVVDLSLSDDNS